jgi:hypothetical protein
MFSISNNGSGAIRVKFSGLTIRDHTRSGGGTGAIRAATVGPLQLTLDNMVFRNMAAPVWPVLLMQADEGCVERNNSRLTVISSSFHNNRALERDGLGVLFVCGGAISVLSSSFTNNLGGGSDDYFMAPFSAIGVFYGDKVLIDGCTFSKNSLGEASHPSAQAAVVSVAVSKEIVLTRSKFIGNGAVSARLQGYETGPYGTLVAKQLLFQNNAVQGLAGGLMLMFLDVCELSDIAFTGNSATGYLYPVVENDTLSSYSEYIAVGALHVASTSAVGEKLSFTGNSVAYNATLASLITTGNTGVAVAQSIMSGTLKRRNSVTLKSVTLAAAATTAVPSDVRINFGSTFTFCTPRFSKVGNKLVQLFAGNRDLDSINQTSPTANQIRVCTPSPLGSRYESAGNVITQSTATCAPQCAAIKFPNRQCILPSGAASLASSETTVVTPADISDVPGDAAGPEAAAEAGADVLGQKAGLSGFHAIPFKVVSNVTQP